MLLFARYGLVVVVSGHFFFGIQPPGARDVVEYCWKSLDAARHARVIVSFFGWAPGMRLGLGLI